MVYDVQIKKTDTSMGKECIEITFSGVSHMHTSFLFFSSNFALAAASVYTFWLA